MGIKGQSLLNYMKELNADINGFVISINKYQMEELINDGFSNINYDIITKIEGIDKEKAINIAVKDYRPYFKIIVCNTLDKHISTNMSAYVGLKITNERINNEIINYLKEYQKVDDIEPSTLLRLVIDYKNKENECPFYFAGNIRWNTGMVDTYMLNLMDYSKV